MNQELKNCSEPADLAQLERRRHTRHPVEHVVEPGAASSPAARFWARMVDISDGGIGVEMVVSLEAGTPALVSGELHSNRFCVGLRGPVRVAYCRPKKDGIFRIGLEFQGTSCSNLDCAHAVGKSGWIPEPPETEGDVFVETPMAPNGSPRRVYIQTRVWGNLEVTPAE